MGLSPGPSSGSGPTAIAEVRTVLVVAAERHELRGIRTRCRRVSRLRWPVDFAVRGELNGQVLLLAANGPGPKRASQAVESACDRERIDAVVSTGTCGALDPELRPGEIYVAVEVRALDAGLVYAAQAPRAGRLFRSGPLVSVDRVVCTLDEKQRLRTGGAGAVEMEAAGVAARASERNLPFFCIRSVLDQAGECFQLDFNAARDAVGRFSRPRIVRAALACPWVLFPELFRIRRAYRKAARALGDFFADCRF